VSRAVLSLGGNVGNASATLAAAVVALGSAVRATSRVYLTPPWGPVPQPDFHNQIVVVDDPERDEWNWLETCRDLEAAAGRERLVRWGPRSLDVDIIAVWRDEKPVFSDHAELVLPHPRAAERAFVLVPWLDADPYAELPGKGPVAELIARLDPVDIGPAGVRPVHGDS
jgi:2-amino-4-hydroxy-6-hydroxymethyldihydropteridine diphosphokinase